MVIGFQGLLDYYALYFALDFALRVKRKLY